MLLAANCVLFVAIILCGIVVAAYYWRWRYEDISERMNTACTLLDEGRVEEARDVLDDH